MGRHDHRRHPGVRLVRHRSCCGPFRTWRASMPRCSTPSRLPSASFRCMDSVPDVTDRPGAIDPGTIQGDIEFDHVDFYYEAGQAGADRFLAQGQARRDDRAGRADGRRQVDHRQPGLPLLRTQARRRSASAGAITPSSRCTRSSRASAWCCKRRTCFPARFARTSAMAGWTRRTKTSKQAARLAGAHDFIATLEKGYDARGGRRRQPALGRAEAIDQPGARGAGAARKSLSWTRRPARWTR